MLLFDEPLSNLDAKLRVEMREQIRALQKRIGELAMTPLDRSPPPWQMHLVEDYEGGSGLIIRIHHCTLP